MEYFVVAFLDVLGFSRMVASDAEGNEPKFVGYFLKAIDSVRAEGSEAKGLDVRMFSDSIIVSAPLSPESVTAVLKTCSDLQAKFLEHAILLRGGVSLGKHYADGAVIYSAALIDAYRLESSRARFPRIVIDPNLLNYFLYHPELSDDLRTLASTALRRDRDGLFFVHYLQSDGFEDTSKHILRILHEQKVSEETVLEKIRWLHDYHSYAATSYGKAELTVDGLANDFAELEQAQL